MQRLLQALFKGRLRDELKCESTNSNLLIVINQLDQTDTEL